MLLQKKHHTEAAPVVNLMTMTFRKMHPFMLASVFHFGYAQITHLGLKRINDMDVRALFLSHFGVMNM